MNSALLLVVWLSWGLSYPIIAVALRDVDLWTCRIVVMLLGGAVLLGLAALRGSA